MASHEACSEETLQLAILTGSTFLGLPAAWTGGASASRTGGPGTLAWPMTAARRPYRALSLALSLP
eukprot:15474565-Heterocapsa_arctica.AAC.1